MVIEYCWSNYLWKPYFHFLNVYAFHKQNLIYIYIYIYRETKKNEPIYFCRRNKSCFFGHPIYIYIYKADCLGRMFYWSVELTLWPGSKKLTTCEPSYRVIFACRAKLIAWRLRHPKLRTPTGRSIFFTYHACFDLCIAVHFKISLCQILPDGGYG